MPICVMLYFQERGNKFNFLDTLICPLEPVFIDKILLVVESSLVTLKRVSVTLVLRNSTKMILK